MKTDITEVEITKSETVVYHGHNSQGLSFIGTNKKNKNEGPRKSTK